MSGFTFEVFDLREDPPKSNKKTLTLEMIDGDGYGGNLSSTYSTNSEYIIKSSTAEYNRLSGEQNSADKLIRKYRRRTMGWMTTIILDIYDTLVNACIILEQHYIGKRDHLIESEEKKNK